MENKVITLAHGAGGRQTSELIGGIFKKYFANKDFTPDDAAVLQIAADKIANIVINEILFFILISNAQS